MGGSRPAQVTVFPPFTTVQHYFHWMRDSGLLDPVEEALVSTASGRAQWRANRRDHR